MHNQSYSAYADGTSDLFAQPAVVYAGFWERFAAVILDGLILLIPNLLLKYSLGPYSLLVTLIVSWLYAALQESGVSQATIGKKAVGIKVTSTEGERISFAQATGRHFGKYISAIILFIGYLMMLWDERRQTLHDKMAGTLIVKQ